MLKDKIILLTGATGGIGSEIARSLAAQGVRLILIDMQQQTLDSLAQILKSDTPDIELIATDLATSQGRERVRKILEGKYEVLDGLINCAGINTFSMFADMEEEQVEKMISVNITSPILLTKQLLPLLRRSERGQIINFGSTFGSIAYPGFAIYSATKFAMRGFTEALRRELAKTNISVSYIAPRATKTKINTGPVNDMNAALGVKMDEPSVVAVQVVEMLNGKKSSTRYLGWPEKLFVKINSVLPGMVDGALLKKLDTITHFACSKRS